MVKMQFTNNQTAFDYVIYMIVGSYFKKTYCTNNLLEKKMRIHYCEQKQENQYRMEDVCIDYVEKKMLPVFPGELWDEDMQVRLRVDQRTGKTEIHFSCPRYILHVRGEYRGKRSIINCELLIRKSGCASERAAGSLSNHAPCVCVSDTEGGNDEV